MAMVATANRPPVKWRGKWSGGVPREVRRDRLSRARTHGKGKTASPHAENQIPPHLTRDSEKKQAQDLGALPSPATPPPTRERRPLTPPPLVFLAIKTNFTPNFSTTRLLVSPFSIRPTYHSFTLSFVVYPSFVGCALAMRSIDHTFTLPQPLSNHLHPIFVERPTAHRTCQC